MSALIIYNGTAVLFTILAFGLLRFLQIPTGSILDWVIGIAILEWLLAIVTIPWNIHFAARSTVTEAQTSLQNKIAIDPQQLDYARKIARQSAILAVALHLISAASLYWLAAKGLTPLGYLSSAAALLLTFLRPAYSTYEYLYQRLSALRQQFTYPREDVNLLRDQVRDLELQVRQILQRLDPDNRDSWLSEQERRWDTQRTDLAKLGATITEWKATNEIEHDRLSREAQQAISQLTVDGQFLDRVREIIRFFKAA